jgi:hypothetical protein
MKLPVCILLLHLATSSVLRPDILSILYLCIIIIIIIIIIGGGGCRGAGSCGGGGGGIVIIIIAIIIMIIIWIKIRPLFLVSLYENCDHDHLLD